MPTFYGDEISRVNGLKYAANCLKAVSKVRLGQAGLFYEPKFDFGTFDESGYRVKQADNTLHHEILRAPRGRRDWRVADLGSSRGVLSAKLAEKVAHVTSADVERPPDAGAAEAVELDLDGDFDRVLGRHSYDCVLVLDVLEHLEATGGRRSQDRRDPEARRDALREHRQHRIPRHAAEPHPRPVQLREARHPRSDAHASLHDLFVQEAAHERRLQ